MPGVLCRVLRVPWVSPSVRSKPRVANSKIRSGGSSAPPPGRTLRFPKPRPNAFGRQTGRVNAQESAYRNGFVSRYELLAAFHRRLPAITSAAHRPAGTREALPGTICETFVPHFPVEGTLE